jgi:hypothetical protein
MKVQRLIDGQIGWAIQMPGAFVFRGRVRPAGMFVVHIEHQALVLGAGDFRAHFNVGSAMREPPDAQRSA